MKTMKRLILTAVLIATSMVSFAQVGVGNNDPKATLDVTGKATTATSLDGIIAPRVTGDQLRVKNYTADQKGAIVYVTAADTAPAGQTINANEVGYYYFDATAWQKMTMKHRIGDVKYGFQTADHNGWIQLEGRSLTMLTTTQQTAAGTLGFSGNLPNATNSFMVQNGSTLGSISSSNAKTISVNNLPNKTLSGTTSSTGNHRHSINGAARSTSIGGGGNGLILLKADGGTHNSNYSGTHTHTFTTSSINGGVTQQTLDITPKSMSVNTFVYLGN